MTLAPPPLDRISLAHVRAALERSRPREVWPSANETSAAVAIVLAESPAGLELLLIRRATRPHDPWSGQMGLPGGRWEPGDGLLFRTAVRETREETGVELESAELLGCLDSIAAVARGRSVGIGVVPFVFALPARAACAPSDEVDEAFWTPLQPLYSGRLDTTVKLDRSGASLSLAAWDVDGRIVWGLTYSMLDDLLRRLRALARAPSAGG